MKRVLSDLLLGVRLALGGGRTSWVRLTLTGVGIGIGVAVLLVASSLPTVISSRAERTAAAQAVTADPETSGDVLYANSWTSEFRGRPIAGRFVHASGPGSPVPPGLSGVPGAGEIVLSPALADLLDSPEGELLRARFPQQRVGVISQAGLTSPHDLTFVAGDPSVERSRTTAVVSYGGTAPGRVLDQVLTLLILVGVVALLFPVLVFVGITTRLAGAERDRRLAALRLVGAGAQRVRLIAAGEALLGAVTGLAVGAALFLAARAFVEEVRLAGLSVFVDDLTPAPLLAALIAVLVPVLAVVTSVVAMRRTVVEPLGVVRRSKPVRRVLWWRAVPIFIGAPALVSQSGALGGSRDDASTPAIIGGILMVLLGIPLLLPWVVERAVGRLRGGAPSWQLAIRRLQLESGTAARVVGGVAVVLAGGIALQSVMASAESKLVDRPSQSDPGRVMVHLSRSTAEVADRAAAMLERSPGVQGVHPVSYVQFMRDEQNVHGATVAGCEVLRLQTGLSDCRDGDAFFVRDSDRITPADEEIRPGTRVVFYEQEGEEQLLGAQWVVPEFTEVTAPAHTQHGLVLTPGALKGVDVPLHRSNLLVQVDTGRPDVGEHVRNAIAPLTWRTFSYNYGEADVSQSVKEFRSIRQALLAGSLITLLLAGSSLLVLALEQVRERRRPLAVLAASGVPRATLGRSLLWQNAVPLLLSLAVAVSVGSGLAVLLLRIVEQPIVLDWSGITVLSTAATALVAVVTLLTLPSLHRATGALGLRSE
ncbi:ABC transporter permease [Saccharothrix algeriensis]|uniref:ABC transporter permease n=1 Tax=Saccharothrix algeriensis TaxID=173560 RepID=A0A8T8HRR2_9PSEU|nr:FtsX-like permease family protein [Saccharothrix algeriensis]MBM7812514.1 ABC-type lipoprotein release transport system permease subunit [Saccharothrix algeriensis]QTR01248.1 ABC transporter permease [Saccharothrix algeriensis]